MHKYQISIIITIMKFKIISILNTILIFLTSVSTSCKSTNNQLTTIIDNVALNFNAPSINLGKVNSINQAKTMFTNELLNSDKSKLNEIIFDLFNFLAKDGFSINYDDYSNKSLQILPNDINFISLYNEKKCVMNTQYDYKFITDHDSNNFMFIFKGFLNIQMVEELFKDNINLKKGDTIQFFYDIESWIKVDIGAIQTNNDFIVQMQYSYTKPNNVNWCIGLIKLMPWSGDYYPDLSINNMADVNFTSDKHHIFRCELNN